MLGFKFQLLPKTEGFWIFSTWKCIYDYGALRQAAYEEFKVPYIVPRPSL